MKKCKECQLEKPVEDFYRDALSADGHRNNCKVCKNTKTIKWREENRAHYNEIARKHNRVNYQVDRLRRYEISLKDHTEMLVKQNYVCAICDKPPTAKRCLATDHDHTTKEVRGLLCYKCNRDMVVVDDKEHLAKLLSYRDKKHKGSK